MITSYVELPASQALIDAQVAYNEALEYFNENVRPDLGYNNNGGHTAVVKAIVGSVEDFEKNYAEFENTYLSAEFQAEVEKLRQVFMVMRGLEKEERILLD